MELLIGIVFFACLATLLFKLFRDGAAFIKNKKSPELSVEATIISKRLDVWYSSSSSGKQHHRTRHEAYYITFEFSNKERLELKVNRKVYSNLLENVSGTLTFKGMRYLNFEAV